jgi:hypothetical protein
VPGRRERGGGTRFAFSSQLFLLDTTRTRRQGPERMPGAVFRPRHFLRSMTAHHGDPSRGSLPLLLGRIVSDPRRTSHLHGVLGWYCHESRNLLNSLKMSIYLAKRIGGVPAVGPWAGVEARYGEVERYIDRLHRLCRPVDLCPVRVPLDLLIEEKREVWSRDLSACGRGLELERPAEPALGSFDPSLLGAALDDLVAWRVQHGVPGSMLRVSWGVCTRDAEFDVRWSEAAGTGPSPPCADRPLRDPECGDALSLFSLPFLSRIVTLHGGTVESSEHDGWQLRMRWPTDTRTSRRD